MRIGIALSGGGFRATLYHLGVIRFLRDSDLLSSVSHITSVSGGSVIAAHLVLHWDRYCGSTEEFDAAAGEILEFVALDVRNRILRRYPWLVAAQVLRPLLGRAGTRLPSRTTLLEGYYAKHLFGDACLHQLPARPEIHILSTNVGEGGLCSFTREGLLIQKRSTGGQVDFQPHRAGLTRIASAVAASSAFPAFFPPLGLRAHDVGATEGEFPPLYLSDGGIFDNLGVRMFRYLAERSELHVRRDDVIDMDAALEAWRRAGDPGDRSSLRHLRENPALPREAEQPDAGDRSGQERDLVEKLDILVREGSLQRDTELLASVRDADGPPPADAASTSEPSAEPRGNREIIAAAFRRATGRECLRTADALWDVLLASDAGRGFTVYGRQRIPGFLSTALRSSDILMDRVWQLERENFANAPRCVFAAISDIVPESADPHALHPEVQSQLSRIRTDLDRFRAIEVSGLVRHGYCVARAALRSLPSEAQHGLADGPPWDPATRPGGKGPAAKSGSGSLGEHGITDAARKLQMGTRRRVWSTLLDVRDWITWVYVPLLVVVAGVLPVSAYHTYRHARLSATLTRALAEIREDFGRMLDLLEFGPPTELPSMPFTEVEKLGPRLAEAGLDIVSDTRITDLRAWFAPQGGQSPRVYVSRHVLVRKVSASESPPGLLLQSLWDSPELTVRCRDAGLRPTLRRCNVSPTRDPGGPFAWDVMLDFSEVPVGETVEVVVEIQHTDRRADRSSAPREWWRFEIDAQPEIATSWILLPRDIPHEDYGVVRWRNNAPGVVELVRPTHQTRMQRGAVIHWSVVHPESGYTYSCRWGAASRK